MRNISQALERAEQKGVQADDNGRPEMVSSHRSAIGPDPEIRALTGRLEPLLASRHPAKILLTACGRGEGATTVARKLANALATDGHQVLLCASKAEMASVMAIDCTREESEGRPIIPTSVASLYVVDISDLQRAEVNAGAVVAFQNWLEAQPPRFDVIIVDMPPILIRQSWLSIVSMPDGIILVVEAERTRSMVLKTTVKTLQEAGGHILGIVFNKRRHHIPHPFYKRL